MTANEQKTDKRDKTTITKMIGKKSYCTKAEESPRIHNDLQNLHKKTHKHKKVRLRNVKKKSHKEMQNQYKTTSKRCKRTTKL